MSNGDPTFSPYTTPQQMDAMTSTEEYGIVHGAYGEEVTRRKQPSALGALGGGAAGIYGLMGAGTGGTGFLIMGIAQLASGILGAMFAPKPRVSPQELAFARMTKYYYNLGQKTNMLRATAASMTGGKPEDFENIGYKNTTEAYKALGVQEAD